MADDRRYSIIPARAVTDTRLEGRDLQVLCFLGTHTDKLGWCFMRQGLIADKLGCGRSTVQRSLARLCEAGWVQTRAFGGSRPHACHAYRVIMDTDDVTIAPPEYPVDGADDDERCPPVGTSGDEVHHPRAPVPMHGRAPPPPEVPTYTWAHNDQDSGGGSGSGSARAREGCVISAQAQTFALELAAIAGHDPEFLPPKWMSEGPAARVQMMLDRGWQPAMMRETAQAVMRHKRDGPPNTIRYFEQPFARAHALQSTPAPLPSVTAEPMDKPHAQAADPNDWRTRRDAKHRAFAELRASNQQARERGSDDGNGNALRLVQDAGRRG